MVYLLFGNQSAMIKKQLKKLIKDFFDNGEENIIKIDGINESTTSIIDEGEQLSLLMDKKAIVYENSFFLTNSKTKNLPENNLDLLEKFLKNDREDLLIIFTVNYDSISNSNKIVKTIKQVGKIFELKNLDKNDWPVYVKKYFQNQKYLISDDAVEEMVKRCQGDLNIFLNESAKLLLYCENGKIEFKDVDLIVTIPLEENVFELTNEIYNQNKDKALKIYRGLTTNSVEVVSLISLICTSLIFMDQVVRLKKEKFSNDDIAKELGTTPGRIYMTLKNSKNLNSEKISQILEKLYELDKNIKHNSIDRFYGFEKFLMEI